MLLVLSFPCSIQNANSPQTQNFSCINSTLFAPKIKVFSVEFMKVEDVYRRPASNVEPCKVLTCSFRKRRSPETIIVIVKS